MTELLKCRVCLEVKGKDHFYIIPASGNRRRECKACQYKRCAKRAKENQEKERQYKKVWRQKNRNKIRAQGKAYYEKNKERILKRNTKTNRLNREKINARIRERHACDAGLREKSLAASRAWKKRNRGYVNAYKGAVKAHRRCATPKWADRNAIKSIYKKASRLTAETGGDFEVDHIVPLISDVVCGLHVEFNLQILPARVNAAKNNRWWPDMP